MCAARGVALVTWSDYARARFWRSVISTAGLGRQAVGALPGGLEAEMAGGNVVKQG